jgi:sterol desaturase/sphingolipid hydroxylase (fatty acid hydroxylase superfamily)
MFEWLANQGVLRWSVFAGAFLAIGLWETYRPFRPLLLHNGKRWIGHIALTTIAHALTFLLPFSAALVAEEARTRGIGLLAFAVIPMWVQYAAGVVLLDFVRWAQHLTFHRVQWLWRLHRVHHSDPDYDLTTTLRFHPFEAIAMQATYLAAVFVMAPPPAVAFGVEVVLLAQNFFGHANVRMPARVERLLRRVLVTPDMHRIHHSVRMGEQNSNYGTMFPWWDRLFGTYREQPVDGAERMTFGLEGFPQEKAISIWAMLILPFRKVDGATPAPREEESVHAAASGRRA